MASSHLRAIATFTLTVAAVSLAACNVSDYQIKKAPQGPGLLHLQNGGIPAQPVDVYLDTTNKVATLAFGDTITLVNVPYGSHTLKFSSAGHTDSLAGFPIFISTGRIYTEIFGGDAAGPGGQTLVGGPSTSASVPTGDAALRIYSTVDVTDYPATTNNNWAGNLAITLIGATTNDTVTVSGINQFNALPLLVGGQTAAGYQPLPPDTYSLIVVNSDSTVDTLLKNVTITVKAGQRSTATIAGLATGALTVQLLPIVADSGQ